MLGKGGWLLGAALIGLGAWWFSTSSRSSVERAVSTSQARPTSSPAAQSSPAPSLGPSEPTAHGAPQVRGAHLPARPASPELYWQELETIERTDKQRALQYALAGEQWYPDEGKPAEARRAKIVTLLVALGRMPEARERTRAFLEQYPNSPYRRLVQGVTGIHPRPGAPH